MVRNIEVDFNRLPQIRSDPTIPHRTVIVSTQRQGVKKEKNEKCPFCPGNEEETPKELVRIPNFLDAAKWQVRGFANAFPFLMIEDGNNGNSYSQFWKEYLKKGTGAHELVVESPKHDALLSLLSLREIAAVLEAISCRYWDLKKDLRFKYFFTFKNFGEGASQDHPHWQLEARAYAPQLIYQKLQEQSRYWITEQECLYCRLLQEEKDRYVCKNKYFLAYVPWAPAEPYQIRIVPKEHFASFAVQFQNKEIMLSFASILKESMLRIKILRQGNNWEKLTDPQYVTGLYTAPYGEELEKCYHWSFDILPRTTFKVGHERGTGEDIIKIFPEEAAAQLRAVKIPAHFYFCGLFLN